MICQQAFWSFSAQYKLSSAGIVSEEDWQESESLIHWALRGKGIRYWWEHGRRAGANIHFVNYIANQISTNAMGPSRATTDPDTADNGNVVVGPHRI